MKFMTLDHAPHNDSSAFPRIAPFALFMLFIAMEEGLRFLDAKTGIGIPYTFYLYLYPVKIAVVGAALIYFRKSYTELNWIDFRQFKRTTLSIAIGFVVFILWINMTWTWATFGSPKGFEPYLVSGNLTRNFLIISRIFGASVIVPVMEEIFWRSWLLRYLISADFNTVAIGRLTPISFIIGTVLFGLEHNLWFAGILAGAFYTLLLYHTKSIAQCILAHSVTNMLLGIYVVYTCKWHFW
jgi:CAAX prenyl protease-like protein